MIGSEETIKTFDDVADHQVAAPGVDVFETGLVNQQVDMVYSQAPAAVVTAFLLAMLVSMGLWSVAEHSQLLFWFGAQFIQTVFRLLLIHRFRCASPEKRNNPQWAVLFFSGVLVAGIIWGCVGLLFDFAWPVEYQTLVVMSLAGVLAGAISSYAAMLSIYVAFMVPAILIPAQAMLMHNSSISHNIGLLFMLFAGVLLVIAKNHNRNVIQSLQLRDENSDLVRAAQRANTLLKSEIESRQHAQEQLLRERGLFTEGPVTVFRWEAREGRPIDYVSETVSQFGYDSASLIQEKKLYSAMVHPNDFPRLSRDEIVSNGKGLQFSGIDYRLVCSDGAIRWVYDYTIPVTDESGAVTHYAGYLLDITNRKQAEYELEQQREHAQVTLHSIADAVITTDVNGQIEYLNPRAEELTGWEKGIARGLSITRIFSLLDGEGQAAAAASIKICLLTGETVKSQADVTLKRDDGVQYTVRYTTSPICVDKRSAVGVIVVMHDVTEAKVMERKLSYQASHDALTGLINRSEFENQLGFSIKSARQASESHVLCLVDVDQLVIINDTCSHEAGDELLREITCLLQEFLRGSDVLSRLGNDEFGLLLKNCSLEGALELAGNILSEIKALRFYICDRMYEVSASIGVTVVDGTSNSVNRVLIEADLACHAAKDLGGKRYHVYDSEDEGLARKHDAMQWISKLTEAIELDRLVLYCQEIVPILTDGTAGQHIEVLVRMLGENDEIIPPDRFLPAAERYNLITSLDRWVVSHSFSWCADRCKGSSDISLDTMAINLSGASITDSEFLEFIIAELHRCSVPPGVICFEITETTAIANLGAATRFINKLKKLGCRFALDDFGSGLSSFAYLKNLPVDYLKIDGSFVRDMATDDVDCALVRSIHQLGGIFGIKTIAEFVENDEIFRKLADIGVDYAQGYGISRPMPLEEAGKAVSLPDCEVGFRN